MGDVARSSESATGSSNDSPVPVGDRALAAPFPTLPVERFFAYFDGPIRPVTGVAACMFEGEALDWERLVASIEDIVAEHPKLGSRLVRTPTLFGSRMTWEPVRGGARAACTAFDPDPTLDDPAVLAARVLSIVNDPLDISQGPGIRFWHMPHRPGRFTLVFQGHHACFDGHGALLFAVEVCARYNGFDSLGLSGDPTVPSPPIVPGGFWEKAKLVAGLVAFRIRRALRFRFAPPATLFDARRSADGGVGGVIHIIPQERCDAYFAGAKAHGVSFNDFFLAAVARVLPTWMRERGLEPGTARFAVNQDLRDLANLDRIAEIRSSAFPVWSAGPPAIDGHELVLDIHRQTQECRELRVAEAVSLFGFMLALPEWLVRRFLVSAVTEPKLCDSMIVSNMGRLPETDPEKGGMLRLGMARLIGLLPYARCTDGIGLMTVPFTLDGKLNLNISYHTGLFSHDEVERLAELIGSSMDELATMAPD